MTDSIRPPSVSVEALSPAYAWVSPEDCLDGTALAAYRVTRNDWHPYVRLDDVLSTQASRSGATSALPGDLVITEDRRGDLRAEHWPPATGAVVIGIVASVSRSVCAVEDGTPAAFPAH